MDILICLGNVSTIKTVVTCCLNLGLTTCRAEIS